MKKQILPLFIGLSLSVGALAQTKVPSSTESKLAYVGETSSISSSDTDTISSSPTGEEVEIIEGKAYADVGLDILNNFIWRGIPLDPGPNLQPAVIVGYGNLEMGFLGSYSIKYDFNNIMTYLSYNLETKFGTFKPMIVDYYYPYDPVEFSNFKERDGDPTSFSHTVETGLKYTGKKIPLSLYASINVLNDPLNSTYLETAYKMDLKGVELEPFVGAVLDKSPAWHAADKAGLVNVGLNAYKTIQVTKEYGLPLTGTIVWHSQMNMLNVMVRLSIL